MPEPLPGSVLRPAPLAQTSASLELAAPAPRARRPTRGPFGPDDLLAAAGVLAAATATALLAFGKKRAGGSLAHASTSLFLAAIFARVRGLPGAASSGG